MGEQDVIIEAYLELATKINAEVPEVKFIDLWADQLALSPDKDGKFPFTLPAVFLEFVCQRIGTRNGDIQEMDVLVIVRLAVGSYAETYHKSINKDSALKFGKIFRKIYNCLQNHKSDVVAENMNRTNWTREQAPPFVYSYSMSFQSTLIDDSGVGELPNEVQPDGLNVEKGTIPADTNQKRFDIDL